jgi:hypothetical protein
VDISSRCVVEDPNDERRTKGTNQCHVVHITTLPSTPLAVHEIEKSA